MALSRFQSNLRFALRKESIEVRNSIPLNRPEQIGNWLAWLSMSSGPFLSELPPTLDL